MVAVLLSWRKVIPFVSSQSWWVYLIRYYNGTPAFPMLVRSSCTIWDLTSYQFVPMNEGIVTKKYVIWGFALVSSMDYSYIVESLIHFQIQWHLRYYILPQHVLR